MTRAPTRGNHGMGKPVTGISLRSRTWESRDRQQLWELSQQQTTTLTFSGGKGGPGSHPDIREAAVAQNPHGRAVG